MAYPSTSSAPTDLLSQLSEKFELARKSGELFYFPSTAKDVYTKDGRRFNLRCCPALLNKEQAKSETLAALGQDSPKTKRRKTDTNEDQDDEPNPGRQNPSEPFKPPYVPELYLGSLEGLEGEPGLSVLFNKYAVLPEHLLLCPAEYEPQSLPPSPHQLALAYLFLAASSRHPTRPKHLLAFYNGGEGAGASQRWRHLQVIEVPSGRAPVEEWLDGVNVQQEDEATIHPSLPYLHIVHSLASLRSIPYPPPPDAIEHLIDTISAALMHCMDILFLALRHGQASKDQGWNLLMTLDHLHLIPRSSPSFALDPPHKTVELNSLAYAGMMLVRSEDEQNALLAKVEQSGGLMSVLQHCGIPRDWGVQAVETANLHRGFSEGEQLLDGLASGKTQ